MGQTRNPRRYRRPFLSAAGTPRAPYIGEPATGRIYRGARAARRFIRAVQSRPLLIRIATYRLRSTKLARPSGCPFRTFRIVSEKSRWTCVENPVGVSEQDPQPDGSQDQQRDRRDNIWKVLPLHRQRISWPNSAATKLAC